jgi:Ankyrin repeat
LLIQCSCVEDAGYPLELSKEYSTRKSTINQSHIASSETSSDNDAQFSVTQDRQEKAYLILGRGLIEPTYFDPVTGDNVLHALARVKPGEKHSLIPKIQDFVLKDVDLNHHNRDRDGPLIAFISERPVFGQHKDETGATLSKYLDTLLWKDTHPRIPNRINVNMRNREGATALYYAATRARPDSVRSLIEAGANVNARLGKLI